MNFPYFFQEDLSSKEMITLTEETSRHAIQVLRMKAGERIQLTDGKGKLVTAEIISEHKKNAEIKVLESNEVAPYISNITIAISPVKNTSRFEWFLEKATEIGVSAIIPMLCSRTEKLHLRMDRMQNILVSAMLQSQQAWMPVLHEPKKINDIINTEWTQKKYIAYCSDEERNPLTKHTGDAIILIGPEGDFTNDEIKSAVEKNFIPVILGETRLRTETAGIVAATLLRMQS